jgi:hypothetical protein
MGRLIPELKGLPVFTTVEGELGVASLLIYKKTKNL